MKQKESYIIAAVGIGLVLIKVAYYILALGFDNRIDSLRDVSDDLGFFFLIYVTIKYIGLLRGEKEK
ncbi:MULTISPECIES: hypothetical protein [unclassified Flavobacterium]|uniref:hypothetical protein n=1 Tax=unclassified Flavobacterium TaxID=196869 RepID=UPI001F13FFE7|nr:MULTISPECIES: hypothetical protein [unclassified Flavobacterium]UMY66769.1 hypothetical protein MKO97_05135 [Flavobacterium sp. HJ-32-4]